MDRNAMIAEAEKSVRSMVGKKRLPSSVDPEDIVQAGLVAVVKAANEYDDTLGVPWIPYAVQRANWAITDELRAGCRRSDDEVIRRAEAGDVQVPMSTNPADMASARETVLTGRVGRLAESLPSPDAVAERVARLREAMYAEIAEEDVRQVMQAVLAKAKAGNTGAAKLLVEMLNPSRSGTKIVQQQAIVINADDLR